jgi:ABC-2 type transport system permease protein
VSLLVHELRSEQKLFWRSRELALFTFLLPILFLLLLGSVYGSDRLKNEGGIKASSYLLAGMLGYGAAAIGFTGLAIVVVIRREEGILKRVRGTPLPGWGYLAGLIASFTIVYALQAVALVAIARAAFGVGVPAHLFSLALSLLLGTLAFAALGLGLTGAIRSAEGSSAVANAIFLPMAFISGSFWSTHAYPRFLQAIADVLPMTYFIRLVRDVALRHAEIWNRPGSVAVVAAWGAVGAIAALRGFRWMPRER